MSNPIVRFVALLTLDYRRRSLAHILRAMSDHHLRDIGIERNFIDDAVASYVPSLQEAGSSRAADTRSHSAPVLHGCG